MSDDFWDGLIIGSVLSESDKQRSSSGHGCLYWLLIGWWAWMFKLIVVLMFLPFAILIAILKVIFGKR